MDYYFSNVGIFFNLFMILFFTQLYYGNALKQIYKSP